MTARRRKLTRGTLALLMLLLTACGGRAIDSTPSDGTPPSGDGDTVSEGGSASTGGASSAGGAPTTSGGAPGVGGAIESGVGGNVIIAGVDLAALVGDYDLAFTPDDADCEGLIGHVNLGLRLDDSGALAARVFENFEWSGFPDAAAVVYESAGPELRIVPGPGASLDGSVTDEGLRFPIKANGFVSDGEVVTGTATVISECDGVQIEQHAEVTLRPDVTSPHIRDRFSTRYNYYPFTWTLFRFSEPLGFTGDTYPFASFSSPEVGDQFIVMRNDADPGSESPGSFAPWPWGPVAGLVLDADQMRRGGSLWFQLIGEESDAAGNPLVTDLPYLWVVDIGPLEARHDFNTQPPLGGFWDVDYEPPGGDGLCEGDGGCVLMYQAPDWCEYEESQGGANAFAFRVGGADVPGGLTKGFRARYRVLTRGIIDENHLYVETGTVDFEVPLATPSPLPSPIGEFTHASAWSEVQVENLHGPSDAFEVALSWECPTTPDPSRMFVLEWVEAMAAD